jgi:hypothetical protein
MVEKNIRDRKICQYCKKYDVPKCKETGHFVKRKDGCSDFEVKPK